MPIDEWNALCAEISGAMAHYVPQFMTPLSRILSEDEGELQGTGSYVSIDGKSFLLTNHHVAAALQRKRLGHMFNGSDLVYSLRSRFAAISPPTDAAIAPVDMTRGPDANAVPLSRYANSHAPVDGELLFVAGYPGERSGFAFGTLFTPLAVYLAQEDVMQSAALGSHHIAIPWLPDKARSADLHGSGLPLPPGMSGSLVWNTRRRECEINGWTWSPEEARVTGLVFAWSTCSNWIYATKVEYLRAAFPALIKALG